MSQRQPKHGFSAGQADFSCASKVSFNLDVETLVAEAVSREEGVVGADGALLVNTRATSEEGIVRFSRCALSQHMVDWDRLNAISSGQFDRLLEQVADHIRQRDLFAQDMQVGSDARHSVNFRVVSEWAWHSLAARHLFATKPVGHDFVEEFTVIDCPTFAPDTDGSETQADWEIVISLSRRLILVVGCESAEGLRRGILKVIAHLLSERGVVPIKAAIAQPSTAMNTPVVLIGDLASGAAGLPTDTADLPLHPALMSWSEEGLFPIQTGTSMRLADMISDGRPSLPEPVRRFGAILVNAPVHPESCELDLPASLDRRVAAIAIFPGQSQTSSTGIRPRYVVIVVADAFGVLPPAARLNSEQAALYVLNGYKTDADTDGRPIPVFHPGYGTPLRTFSMQQHLLRLTRHFDDNLLECWLLNAGFAFGPFPDGMTMPPRVLSFAFDAIASGELEHVRFRHDPLLGLAIPFEIRGVPSLLMTPKYTWPDRKTYDREAVRFAELMTENFLAMTLPAAPPDESAISVQGRRSWP